MSEPAETVRKMMTFSVDLLREVEEYRSRQRPIPSEAEAIRRLIRAGLEAERKKAARSS